MREVDTHIYGPEGKANCDPSTGCCEPQPVGDQNLRILVTDDPGAGGANHRYEVLCGAVAPNPSASIGTHPDCQTVVLFQNGPIQVAGVNGLTHEVLLAIVHDRLKSFQAGPYPSPHNKTALDHVACALRALHNRTRERVARGVEGTHKP